MLLRRKAVQGNWLSLFQKFKKVVPTLKVNETKLTSRNAFTDTRFAIEREKELKKDERTLF